MQQARTLSPPHLARERSKYNGIGELIRAARDEEAVRVVRHNSVMAESHCKRVTKPKERASAQKSPVRGTSCVHRHTCNVSCLN